MDFSVSEKMQTILGMIKEFVQKELIPLEPEFLTKSFSEMLPVLEEKRRMVRQMELWAPLHPKEYGGMELNLLESALVFEALGETPLGLYTFGCQAPDAGNIEILHQFGSAEQRENYLRPLIEGKMTKRPIPIAFESGSQVSLTDNRYKIYSKNKGKTYMLFDLIEDPGEKKDLALEKPEIIQLMKATLQIWRKSCKDSLVGKDYK